MYVVVCLARVAAAELIAVLVHDHGTNGEGGVREWAPAREINRRLQPFPVSFGKLSTATIRRWRADLLGKGVSVGMAAKAYRLLRAVLMTAVEDDRIIQRNPCRIRGADAEHAAERPVLTVPQVFELADRVGRRPVGNVRKVANEVYRLRFQRHGAMRTHPEVFRTRLEAERAL